VSDGSGATFVPLLTGLIVRDGTSYLARDCWLEAGKLICVTLDWGRRLLPAARLDLDEAVRLNRERNVKVLERSHGGSSM
jgi:hypothetical protein